MLQNPIYIKIILNLHAITCPGVWLCTHGFLQVSIKTLNYFLRSATMEPRFPLIFNEKFIMTGYFKSANTNAELEQLLAAEQLEITLWQNGRRLAHFVGKLCDILQRSRKENSINFSCGHSDTVKLLMKATAAFPGIIAPKVELTAELACKQNLLSSDSGSISDTYATLSSCTFDEYDSCATLYDNETINSANGVSSSSGSSDARSCCNCVEVKRNRQQPVCHAKHKIIDERSTKQLMPTNFVKTNKDLLRKPTQYSHSTSMTMSDNSRNCQLNETQIDTHRKYCKICQKYRRTFSHCNSVIEY